MGFFELTDGYSAFPDEEEVLIQDGLCYKVHKIEEIINQETSYTLISLIYN